MWRLDLGPDDHRLHQFHRRQGARLEPGNRLGGRHIGEIGQGAPPPRYGMSLEATAPPVAGDSGTVRIDREFAGYFVVFIGYLVDRADPINRLADKTFVVFAADFLALDLPVA